MSTRRRTAGVYATPTPRNEKGERLCRSCKAVMPKNARNNCSTKCSTEWMQKTTPSIMRQAVFDRDGGICAVCKVDVFAGVYRNGALRQRRARGSGDLWQADHINPVIEGGGECGLENFRTLCTACHKAATKELRGRMSRRLRDAKAIERDKAGLFADQVDA